MFYRVDHPLKLKTLKTQNNFAGLKSGIQKRWIYPPFLPLFITKDKDIFWDKDGKSRGRLF